jgi:hydroxyacylglutathione hydrolase
VGEGDSLQLGASAVRVMEMPGHHPSHIGFAWQDVWAIGDVLFLAGCGNTRFGGDMEALYETIWNRVRRAPPETRLAWGHDYAEANLRFAERIEPHNPAIAETAAAVAAARSKGQELPWRTVADERAINPFLRLDEPAVVAGAIREAGLAPSDTTPRSVFRALRNLRNAV